MFSATVMVDVYCVVVAEEKLFLVLFSNSHSVIIQDKTKK